MNGGKSCWLVGWLERVEGKTCLLGFECRNSERAPKYASFQPKNNNDNGNPPTPQKIFSIGYHRVYSCVKSKRGRKKRENKRGGREERK